MHEHLHELYDDRLFIGFCGGADEHSERVEQCVRDIVQAFDSRFVGVCGGTVDGVPGIVAATLAQHHIPIVGVLPVRAEWKASPHLTHIVSVSPRLGDSCWGDESEVLVKLCDIMFFFGGGWGTVIELAHAMKINQMHLAHRDEPIILVLLTSFGGTLATVAQTVPSPRHVFVDFRHAEGDATSLYVRVAALAHEL